MKKSFLIFIGIFIFSVNLSCGQQAFTVKESLVREWMVFENGRYEPFADQKDIHTVYFALKTDKYAGDYLSIRTKHKFTLFINGVLATDAGSKFNVDSLAKVFRSTSLWVAVHQRNISPKLLDTSIETPVSITKSQYVSIDKPATFLRDFVVVASIILLSILIVLIRLNPKLASDYFSVARIFSLREADDSQLHTRIANSTNILFYIFCSMILGFYLITVFHFISPGYQMSDYVQASSFGEAFAKWLGLSFIILIIFFLKIILVYITSILFGSKELAGIHFFNWVRLLLIVFSSMSTVLFFYFILRGQSVLFNTLLLNLMAWCLVGWVAIIFLKLRGRSGYSIFHLFSYICATEIIPLLIIITVLYN
jgi:hypothetical protein